MGAVTRQQAHEKWNACAKPLGSLGLLEPMVETLCVLQNTLTPTLSKRTAVIFCADNGVVEEGVTQTGSHVTGIVAKELAEGRSSVNRMAEVAHVEVLPVNIGIQKFIPTPGVEEVPAAEGTDNIKKGPAMDSETLERALNTGRALAHRLAAEGNTLLLAGEMGIGNTTTASAVAAALLQKAPAEVTGKGAGLTDAALSKKVAVIEEALAKNRPDPSDPKDVLRKVGGLDLAGMCGLYLGAAEARVPVFVDGFPSAVAALTALRMEEAVSDILLASHVSAEPAGAMVLEALGLSAPIHAGLRLGEATGAVAAVPLLDMALNVFLNSYTFAEGGIEPYRPL